VEPLPERPAVGLVMGRRIVSSGLVVLLAAGCATAHGTGTDAMAAERRAAVEAECGDIAARAADVGEVSEALRTGAFLGVYLALVGAGNGAWWGAVTGGGAGDGAWIGAAAAAGLGALIGLVQGVGKGVEAHRRYRDAYDRCRGERQGGG